MHTEVTTQAGTSGWVRLVIGRHPRRTLSRIAVTVTASVVIFGVFARPIRVTGNSMFPTYKDQQINFINRAAYAFTTPRREDVVAARAEDPASGDRIVLLKRIVALPGETIEIDEGVVLVNNQPLREPYVRARFPWYEDKRTLGEDEYFIVGDNRAMSQSHHTHGVYKRGEIMGKVLF